MGYSINGEFEDTQNCREFVGGRTLITHGYAWTVRRRLAPQLLLSIKAEIAFDLTRVKSG